MSAVLSVVIPLYNKENHIARAIRSVLAQTYRDFELLVIDDGSTDKSVEVVRNFADSRIKLIQKDNGGVSSARNRGIKESAADLIAFLDADDVYKPDFLEKIIRLKKMFPDASACATNYEVISRHGKLRMAVEGRFESPILLDARTFFEMAISRSPIHSSAVAVKKEVFGKVGLFPDGVKLGEDLDMWIRILFSYLVAFDPCAGSTYFVDAEMRSSVKNLPLRKPYFFKTIDNLCAEKRLDAKTEKAIGEFKNLFVLIYAMNQIWYGSPVDGRRALLECNTNLFLSQKWRWIFLSCIPSWFYRALKSVKTRVMDFVTRA